MAKKIDFSRAKEFLFNHGEKVTLGACAFLALVLGLWGLMSASGASRADGTSKTYAEAIKEHIVRISNGLTRAADPDEDKIQSVAIDWPTRPSNFRGTPFINIADRNEDRRRNPVVLPIRNEPGTIQVDYISGLVYEYDRAFSQLNQRVIRGLEDPGAPAGIQPEPKPKGKQFPMPGNAPTALPFAQVGHPRRMLVVQAIFPMKQQVEEFRKALKMSGQEEMFQKSREDLPRPAGIDVVRIEVMPDGKDGKPEILIGIDADGKFKINKQLEEVLRHSIYDERSPEALKEHIWYGLTTPFPKLANRKYPHFKFPGFDIDWTYLDEAEPGPGMMAGGGNKEFGGGGRKEVPLPGAFKGLPGFKEPRQPPMPNPEGGGAVKAAGPEYKLREMSEKSLDQTHPGLVNRVFGGKEKRLDKDLKVYHILGQFPGQRIPENNQPGFQNPNPGAPGGADPYYAAWDLVTPGGGVPGGGEGNPRFGPGPGPGPRPIRPGSGEFQQQPPGGGPSQPVFPNWDRDALVRFIDPDVKPGKTYYYAIRVRMENPNFGKPGNVLEFGALGMSKELPPSPWVETPKRTIPEEYFLYAADQQLLDDWADGKGVEKKGFTGPTVSPLLANYFTPFQVHQWTPKKTDSSGALTEYVIGDWVIAEKQLVRKGEPIGRSITVPAPVWVKEKDAFEVPQNRDPNAKKTDKNAAKGIHIDLVPDGKAPVLVDFNGGKRLTRSNTLEEETAVDALVLMPNGQLRLMNSRAASESPERNERLINARRRIDEILNQGGGPADPNQKKGPPGPPLPGQRGGS